MEEKVVNAIQDEYPDDFAWCYGCGRLNEKGHHFRTGWQGEQTVTIYTPRPEHTAIPGFVYGGLLASLIDCHGTGSAALALHRKNGYEPGDGTAPPRFVTASLNVQFLKPTPQGVPLKAIGTVEEIHPKKWRVQTEVYANDVLCAQGEVIAVVMPKTFLPSS
ncbi:thioesterase superfamily protein [Anoxybacillus sp. B7M1]|uniref:PaaI family thioesterase n=1 Tax=Anoxybacteroides rupiense TaxID=311460 RepID=A0ABD5IZ17_9BACL|nr:MULTISPECIES: PaaI family thioesterase [Anoxybacillus]ANB55996.1 thioesterase superfamily protein [Anoxybacillus sp. B2M1]ANB62580.1 thioesterase superfamily protein [Anoxybacillus sp. B7M1]MBB3905978.1 acyl-coenzyme A thioesterase PaaI-like protein [Anoxybacillus rupiensis]MDE8565467.1 PaaI family thioesterase [Anoxybacillus rupiensis]MED5053617.1 PaaI family thioesterase [Anoxybacillus rupiensis]